MIRWLRYPVACSASYPSLACWAISSGHTRQETAAGHDTVQHKGEVRMTGGLLSSASSYSTAFSSLASHSRMRVKRTGRRLRSLKFPISNLAGTPFFRSWRSGKRNYDPRRSRLSSRGRSAEDAAAGTAFQSLPVWLQNDNQAVEQSRSVAGREEAAKHLAKRAPYAPSRQSP